MSDILEIGALEDGSKEALRRLIVTLADSKRLMGIRYSDWLLGAPSIETGIATSSMTQDEWGHARLLYAMLKDLGEDPQPYEFDRPGEEYASIAALDEQAPDWAALVAMIVLADGAISAMLRSFAAGAFGPAQARVPKMLAEEEFHASLGAAWYKRLANAEPEARDLLARATTEMLPALIAWVGQADAAAEAMVDLGVIGPAVERLADYRESVGALTSLVGVDVGAVQASGDWDSARGRTGGRPSDEAVERARGDRNRKLLVE